MNNFVSVSASILLEFVQETSDLLSLICTFVCRREDDASNDGF